MARCAAKGSMRDSRYGGMRRRPFRLLSAPLVVSILLVALVPAGTAMGATKYRGAQTHPLWSSSQVSDFDRELDLLRNAGANTVRIDITWSSLQTAGKDRFSSWYVDKIDTFMRHAEARGIKVIPSFHATPCWASSAPSSLKQDCEGKWWDRGVTKYPPEDMAEYAKAAAWVANRWGRYMAGLQIWNEPNEESQNFWKTPDQAGDYARLLKAAYPAVKAVQPNLTVAAGALSFSDGDFTKELYDHGIKGNFDVFSFHPYSESRPPTYTAEGDSRKWSFASGIPWIRKIMLARGDGKPIWLTEFGWTTCNPTTDYGRRRCVTEDQQASYTEKAWQMLAGWRYVKAATQYNLRNKGTDPAGIEDQYGLVHRDFSPKPGYRAFRSGLAANVATVTSSSTVPTAATVLDVAAPAETVSVSSDGVLRARVACPREASRGCRGTLRIRTSNEVEFLGELRIVRLARRSFSIDRSDEQVLNLQLSARKYELLRRAGALRARASVRKLSGADMPSVSSRAFTLKPG